MKNIVHIFWVAAVAMLLSSNLLKGQDTEPDSLLSINELNSALHAPNTATDSGAVFKTSGIANVGSGQLHETYLQIYMQNDGAGVSLFKPTIDRLVSIGDSIVVTGTKQLYHGEPELHVSEYKVYPRDSLTIQAVSLSKVIENPAQYSGLTVEGMGVIQEKGNQFNGKYMMVAESDTAEKAIAVYVSNYNPRHREFDFGTPDVGDEVRLKGVLANYDPTYPDRMQYKILLRTPTDFVHDGWPKYYLEYLAWILAGLMLVSAVWMVSLRRQVKHKTNALQESLEEKEVLLKEIHHRVKNNLASISGLLQLQSETTANSDVQYALEESQTRINSMMMVHEKLYKSSSFKDVHMKKYLDDLAGSIQSTVTAGTSAVDIKVEAEDIDLETDQVIPMGLLVNELLVNVFKHAFKDNKQGIIWISLKEQQRTVTLKVEDNGVGLPENFDPANTDSLGMLLINTFTQQLGAQKTVKNTPGACFIFEFPARPIA